MNYIAIPGLISKRTMGRVGRVETNIEKANRILHIVVEHFGITVEELKSKTRQRRICFPRQIVIYLVHKTTSMSLKDIGSLVGGKDHTTAIYAREAVMNLMDSDEEIRIEIEELRHQI